MRWRSAASAACAIPLRALRRRRAIDRRTRRCEGAERGSDGGDAAPRDPGHQSGHGMPCPNTDTLTPTIIAYRGISRSAACRAPTLRPNTDTPTPTIIAYRGISRSAACRAPTLCPNTDTPTPTIIAYRGISRGTACRAPTRHTDTDDHCLSRNERQTHALRGRRLWRDTGDGNDAALCNHGTRRVRTARVASRVEQHAPTA
jgi:hypothetical protein